MLHRLILAMILALPLAIPALTPAAQAQGGPFFVYSRVDLNGTDRSKFPHVAAFGSVTSVGVNSETTRSLFYEKGDRARDFAGPGELGPAVGFSDYATVSLAYAPDGSLFYVWSNFNSRQILLRARAPGQEFGPQRLVTGASAFPSEPEVAVTDLGGVRTLFVFWREAAGQIKYRYSQDDGLNWSGTGEIVTGAYNEITAFGAPGGKVAVGYTKAGGEDGALKSNFAYWNGTGFTIERISPAGNGDFAEPTLALTLDGRWLAAYTGINQDANYGTYISERQPDGSWPPSRLDRGNMNSVSLVVDSLGNYHLYWAGSPTRGGGLNVYYAFKRFGQADFSTVLGSPDLEGQAVFNVNAATNLRDYSYGHAVTERFDGGIARASYLLAAAPVSNLNADGIVIEQNAAFTNKANLRVDFTNLTGGPGQVRFRWGAPPAEGDSTLLFANPLTVPAPTLPANVACSPQTLHTLLIGSGGAIQNQPNSDQITFDRLLQATASLSLTQNPAPYDQGFTRVQDVAVSVRSEGDCSGLQSASASGDLTEDIAIPIEAASTGSANVTLSNGDGPKTITVTVADRAGNSAPFSLDLALDQTAPAIANPGSITITPDAETSGIVDVRLQNVVVNEANLYGALVRLEVTPDSGPATTGTAQLVPLTTMRQANQSGGGYRFSFSLASGLPASALRAGSYELNIRFVDKAGNVSTGATSQSIDLAAAPTFPRYYLPAMRN